MGKWTRAHSKTPKSKTDIFKQNYRPERGHQKMHQSHQQSRPAQGSTFRRLVAVTLQKDTGYHQKTTLRETLCSYGTVFLHQCYVTWINKVPRHFELIIHTVWKRQSCFSISPTRASVPLLTLEARISCKYLKIEIRFHTKYTAH
jgi:hypothetical protein